MQQRNIKSSEQEIDKQFVRMDNFQNSGMDLS